MNFKLNRKNNIGIVSTLILIMALSHSRIFDFLIESTLGRIVLICFILGISYLNKIFGVIVILFIIIIFNHYNAQFSNMNFIEHVSNGIENFSNEMALETTSATSGITVGGREGFNMVDRESTILKGKRSNEVPVFSNARNQTDEVEPSDKSAFSSEHSSVDM